MSAVVLVLLALAVLSGLVGWTAPRGGRRTPATLAYGATGAVLLLAACAAVTAVGDVTMGEDLLRTLTAALSLSLAVAGGPVVVLVFALADRREAPDPTVGVGDADAVLRGGAWIGALERAAIFVTLVAGWPDGLVAVVGLKGLGRYPELRSQDVPGVAERFIIGTFASVLWAVACAGLARRLL